MQTNKLTLILSLENVLFSWESSLFGWAGLKNLYWIVIGLQPENTITATILLQLSVTMGITQSKQDGRRQRRLFGRNRGRVSHLWGLLRFSDKTSGFILPWGEVLNFTLQVKPSVLCDVVNLTLTVRSDASRKRFLLFHR